MDRLRAGSGDHRVIALASPVAQARAHAGAIRAAVTRVPELSDGDADRVIAAICDCDKG